jgi:hypothetical protein
VRQVGARAVRHEEGRVYAAKFCYRCGRRFRSEDPGWCICGAERRHLQVRPAPSPRPAEEDQPFRWVWCHFFRNALVILAVACFVASATTGNVAWLPIAFVVGFLARFIHVYHETVCKAARRTHGPIRGETRVEGNGETHD